ncbi:hypothetical protein [Priestia megaterium]|uniref:hypothetical protein n=1 Tax=Priestia megaterium TaxID=1404 RepID=UPI0023DA92F3|nr:hypothetical protein [Priestia megaterium]MDF2010212.1 hypothetical protein [Priestia megaterium]
MAKIEQVKSVTTFKLELTEAEMATIVCGMRSNRIDIENHAEAIGVSDKILTRREDSALYFQLKEALTGEE